MGAFASPSFAGLSALSSAYVATAVLDVGLQLVGWAISVALKTEKVRCSVCTAETQTGVAWRGARHLCSRPRPLSPHFFLSVFSPTQIYDFFGTGTFLAVNILTYAWGGAATPRSTAVFVAVTLWALRLGGFLTLRAARLGDSRFEEAKNSPLLYLVFWLMQALWVFVTMSPVVWAHTAARSGVAGRGLWAPDVIGGAIFLTGWAVEAVADAQKFRFKSDPANRGKFIETGLWSASRYPNYFGEICVWSGIFLLCCGSFGAGPSPAWATILSPFFVTALLFLVSGIPLQEKQAAARWGGDPAFEAYRARTNLLVPLPFKCVGRGGGGGHGRQD